MKQIKLFFTAIAALMSLNMVAAGSFTLVVDNPSNVNVGIYDLNSTQPVNVGTGTTSISFNGGDLNLQLTPTEGSAIESVDITYASGKTAHLCGHTTYMFETMIVQMGDICWDGATVRVTTSHVSGDLNGKINVHITGKMSAITIYVNGKNGLQEYEPESNEFEIPFHKVDDSELYIQVEGNVPLYKATLAGKDIPFYVSSDEETKEYTVNYRTTPVEGDLIIISDFPQSTYNLKLSVGAGNDGGTYPGLIKSVYVNGEIASNYANVNLKAGSTVAVHLDVENYDLDGIECLSAGASAPTFINGNGTIFMNRDWELVFNGSRVARDKKIAVYTYGLNASRADIGFSNNNWTSFTLDEGYNVIEFNDKHDNPFNLYVDLPATIIGSGDNAQILPSEYNHYVYLNNKLMADNFDTWSFNFNDGDVLKIYTSEHAPEAYSVQFSLDPLEAAPIIIKDKITTVNPTGIHSMLRNTLVEIKKNSEKSINVYVNNDKQIADFDGTYRINVNKNMTIGVSHSTSVGVDTIEADEAPVVIYNLQGLRVTETRTPGFYIINGKKVLVK